MHFQGLTSKEQGELIKAQILRSKTHNHTVGELVMADWDEEQGTYYLAEITAVHADGTIDVKYTPPYEEVEQFLGPTRVRSIGKSLATARAMCALREAPWQELVKYVMRDIGPQPNYVQRTRRGAHLLYTYEQAQALAGDRKRQRTAYGNMGGDPPDPKDKPKTPPGTNPKRSARAGLQKARVDDVDNPLKSALRKRKAEDDETGPDNGQKE